jgi:DNA-binding transcriptional MerR regulator
MSRAARGGFSLDQVLVLLGLSEDRNRSCDAVDIIAREHLREVDRKIADLQALRRELDSLIRQCRRGKVAEWRIVEMLAPTGI